MVYIKDNRGSIAVVYSKPYLSEFKTDKKYAGRDEKTGEDLFKTVYILKMYFPSGIIWAGSEQFQVVADIERAISRISDGSPEEKYQVEALYAYSLGEDVASHLPLE